MFLCLLLSVNSTWTMFLCLLLSVNFTFFICSLGACLEVVSLTLGVLFTFFVGRTIPEEYSVFISVTYFIHSPLIGSLPVFRTRSFNFRALLASLFESTSKSSASFSSLRLGTSIVPVCSLSLPGRLPVYSNYPLRCHVSILKTELSSLFLTKQMHHVQSSA